jgi:hypothetical protein
MTTWPTWSLAWRVARLISSVASAKELTPMDAHLVEATIKSYLTEIRNPA